MIKVLVNGAKGRMGQEAVKAIEADAQLTLVGGSDRDDDLAGVIAELKPDVVVDLTAAACGFNNTKTIIESGARPVVGTSGFIAEDVAKLQALASEKQIGGVVAPNFSIGAVLMMKFAAEAAKYLPNAEVIEAHSPQKQESPSGTAIRTAELIGEARTQAGVACSDHEIIDGARGGEVAGVKLHSIRLPGVIADQTVVFGAEGENLSIVHSTRSREAFMPGICLACKRVMTLEHLVYGLEYVMD